jgi:hypothetical protein
MLLYYATTSTKAVFRVLRYHAQTSTETVFCLLRNYAATSTETVFCLLRNYAATSTETVCCLLRYYTETSTRRCSVCYVTIHGLTHRRVLSAALLYADYQRDGVLSAAVLCTN